MTLHAGKNKHVTYRIEVIVFGNESRVTYVGNVTINNSNGFVEIPLSTLKVRAVCVCLTLTNRCQETNLFAQTILPDD